MNTEIKATIERLIEQENSPVERGRLLVLLQISNVMSDLSEKNKQLEDKIASAGEYIQRNRRASDRYAGARKLAGSLFFIVQAATGWFVYQLTEVPKKINSDIVAIERRLFVVEQHIALQKSVPLP